MRRVTLYICCAVAALLLLGFLGLFWLFETTTGARFAVSTLTAGAGLNVSVRGVEGRLLDRLHLTGVRVTRPKFQAQIDTLDLAWEPRQLLSGDLVVRELTLSGVRVQDDAAESTKAPQLRWPRVIGVARRFDAQISRFKLQGLSYRHLQAPPQLVSELSTSLSFKNGLLSLSELSLASPDGRVTGELSAGLWHPSLRIDLTLVPTRPVQGMDLFSLQTRLLPGRDLEQLTGGIALAGRSGGAQRLELTAELGMTVQAFNVRRMKFTRPGRRGTLTGEGSVTLTTSEPLFSLALKAADLDLETELQLPTSLSGTLNFSGSPSRYRGRFALANRGPGWQSAALAADYQGGSAGMKLAPLTGTLLEGRLRGALEVFWSEGVRLRGTLSGRGLNPGRAAADWSGLVNLDLTGALELPKQGELRGDLHGKLLESRLHGQQLQGELLAAFAGKRVRVDRLFLKGRGFDLQGAGDLERRLNLAARVSDLSRLVPGAAGQLQADGWVRWRDGLLSGGASGEGNNLAAAGVRAGALRLKASLGEAKGYPLQLDASVSRLRVGRAQVESALFSLRGTAARHTLTAALSSPGSEAQATLSGGYGNGVWSGELARLTGRDGVGPWSLADPARLMLSAERSRIAPFVINGLPGERVELAGELNRHPESGTFRGAWSGVNLARLNGWLDGVEVAGGSSGELSLRLLPGERIIVSGHADAHGTLVTDGERVNLERVTATLEGGEHGLRTALDLFLAGGSGEAHLLFDSRVPALLALPGQGDLSLQWSNLDLALLRPVTPANLIVDGRLAGLVTGKLLPGGRLDLKGNTALSNGHLNWRAEGDEFDASLDTAELSFNWRGGRMGAGNAGAGELTLAGRAAATGAYTTKGQRIALNRCSLRLDADRHGTRAGLDLALEGGGTLRGAVSSASPAALRLPETGELALEWSGINPVLLKPWLPGAVNLEGELAGHASGKLMPGQRMEVAGEADFTQGKAKWQGGAGEVSANLRSANLAFAWRGETLTGTLSLALSEYGQARGDFLFPIPARLPVAANPSGALHGALAGKVQERGFLTAFLPGVVQESQGDLDLDLKLGGIWSNPKLAGTLQLSKGGAYLPSAGIRLSDLQFLARLEGDQLRIDNFRAVSGKGHLEGALLMRLKDWQVAEYSGSLNGDHFQTVYLPELQLVTSPKLSFQGASDSVTLRGDLLVPETLISGPPVRQSITASRDVIMEGVPPQQAGAKFPLAVDGRIHVVLGEKVQVRASGIDAKLGGSMDLVLKGIDSISSRGEIRVVKGTYKAYGLDLNIVRGRLYYLDDPVDQPTLDILALRTVGDVRAGVTVGGYLRAPVVKLYSEPSLPEVDILAYMVLGHPMGASSEQGGMMALAASSLFSFGQSESLQEQIKDRLGLSVLGLETVSPGSAGLMGYKEIPVAPAGSAPSKPAASESLLTVGKYLTPKLYLSYGRSLVTGGNLFMLRYDIFKHWQLETQSGSESGADIYYKLEFN